MLRSVLITALLAASVSVIPLSQQADALPTPQHDVSVSGTGTGMYPTYTSSVSRYAVTTADDTDGTVTVKASTTDPKGTVRINGRLVANGASTTLTDVKDGDEISVFITDSSGTENDSLVYLPADFPRLETVKDDLGSALGDVALTLSIGNQSPLPGQPRRFFDTILDHNGVPVWVESTPAGDLDLKQQDGLDGSGQLTVQTPTTTPGRTGDALVVLDNQYQPVTSYETSSDVPDGDVPLTNTDAHDSQLLADGSRIQIGSQTNPQDPDGSPLQDDFIQWLDASGKVTFQWSSRSLADETVNVGVDDYAHINSIWVTPQGDVLASFRHLSAVLLIAGPDDSSHTPGEIIWKLGGRDSSFAFPAGDSGPCAQHSATIVPSPPGDDRVHVLLFDDGSGGLQSALCVDPSDPSNPPVIRPQSRVTEYALDTTAHTATPVSDYEVPGRYSFYMGSARRMSNGDTLIGWAAATQAIASAVSPTGQLLWELRDPNGVQDPGNPANDPPATGPAYFSYRAEKVVVPDAIKPVVKVTSPAPNASYAFGQKVTADFSCTDRGGSSLQTCGTSVLPGDSLDTSTAGTHTFTAVATDGAHNTSVPVTVHYTVGPAPARYRPDALIRSTTGPLTPRGNNVYGAVTGQLVRQPIRHRGNVVSAVARVQNDGNRSEGFVITGTKGSRAFSVAYFAGTKDVTRQVEAGNYRTARLAPGASVPLRIRVTRLRPARPGNTRTFRLLVVSTHSPAHDAVATVVRATR